MVTSCYELKYHTWACQLCHFPFKSTIWKCSTVTWSRVRIHNLLNNLCSWLFWNRYAALSIISGHIYLWIHISIYRKVHDELASWIIPAAVQWTLAFIYTATTSWYCFHFEIFNIHTRWTSDWMEKQKHLERMKLKKSSKCTWLSCYQQ